MGTEGAETEKSTLFIPVLWEMMLGGLLHQIKGGFTKQSQQSLQSEQSHPKPEAFDCLLELIPNIMIHY